MPQSLITRFKNLPAAQRDAVTYFLLVLAVFAAYCNVYTYDFLLDDQSLIITNLYLRDWHHLPDIFSHLNYAGSGTEKGFFRPVEQTLRLVVYQLFGQSRPAFHALNIIIHACNAMLVYRLGKKLGFNIGAVFAAALLWSVHPIFTQEVTYISSLAELLWTMFTLLALTILLPDFSWRKVYIAVALVMLGFISKETTVVFPALAAVCLFIVSKPAARLKAATYIKIIPFWVLSVAYATGYVLIISYQPFAATNPTLNVYAHHILPRLMTSLATLPTYASVVFYPFDLHMERVFPVMLTFVWPVFFGALMTAAALAQIILGKGKRGLPLTFGFIWFAAAISPMTGIFIPTDALISEGWLYMPLIGLMLGTAQMLSLWVNKHKQLKPFVIVAIAAIALFLGTKTWLQNKYYQNPATFYGHIFDTGGYRTRAFPDLGDYYLNLREYDKAAENFQLAIDNPDERNIPSAAIHAQLALAYLGVSADENYMVTQGAVLQALPLSKKIPEAIDELDASLRLDPTFYFAHTILSVIYRWEGDTKAADYHHEKMIETLRAEGKL